MPIWREDTPNNVNIQTVWKLRTQRSGRRSHLYMNKFQWLSQCFEGGIVVVVIINPSIIIHIRYIDEMNIKFISSI